jgi:hypothetical protein
MNFTGASRAGGGVARAQAGQILAAKQATGELCPPSGDCFKR